MKLLLTISAHVLVSRLRHANSDPGECDIMPLKKQVLVLDKQTNQEQVPPTLSQCKCQMYF